ncbi:hypothetical protein ColLi_13421 [Colletotrichum liriopes]|uniref:Uncharacterized protein n=1 Tax=Colletotrichum liriopes TaxID=708192 RepID=A0AA37M0M6_9PEZI|nr:hypothetical protein ColLi_13421 [Colletotrichum liriopes]
MVPATGGQIQEAGSHVRVTDEAMAAFAKEVGAQMWTLPEITQEPTTADLDIAAHRLVEVITSAAQIVNSMVDARLHGS